MKLFSYLSIIAFSLFCFLGSLPSSALLNAEPDDFESPSISQELSFLFSTPEELQPPSAQELAGFWDWLSPPGSRDDNENCNSNIPNWCGGPNYLGDPGYESCCDPCVWGIFKGAFCEDMFSP